MEIVYSATLYQFSFHLFFFSYVYPPLEKIFSRSKAKRAFFVFLARKWRNMPSRRGTNINFTRHCLRWSFIFRYPFVWLSHIWQEKGYLFFTSFTRNFLFPFLPPLTHPKIREEKKEALFPAISLHLAHNSLLLSALKVSFLFIVSSSVRILLTLDLHATAFGNCSCPSFLHVYIFIGCYKLIFNEEI